MQAILKNGMQAGARIPFQNNGALGKAQLYPTSITFQFPFMLASVI